MTGARIPNARLRARPACNRLRRGAINCADRSVKAVDWKKGDFLAYFAPAGVIQVMDATLLAAALERHGAALKLYARQWTAAPEDVVQEAFVRLACQKTSPEPLAPWLFRVVRNTALNAARSEKRRKRHEKQAGERHGVWFIVSEETALDAATVTQWLQTLALEQREVITLHLWAGLTFAEIATVMDASASSVHRLYQTGLESLRGRATLCLKK